MKGWGGVHYEGVGCVMEEGSVMEGWGVEWSWRGGVGCVMKGWGWGVSCRCGVGCVMKGLGWGCHAGVGWVMKRLFGS